MSRFDSIRQGNVGFMFENGIRVSVFFGAGSYSSNADLPFETRLHRRETITSDNAEVMITDDPTGKMERWFTKKYGDNPAGFLTAPQVIEVLQKAAKCKV